MTKKVLVLCASESSYQNSRAKKILKALEIYEAGMKFYFVGVDLGRHVDGCSGKISNCLGSLGRAKFDVILNEFCPVNAPERSAVAEIMVVIAEYTKKKAIFITPLIPKHSKRSDVLIWDEFASPWLGVHQISWINLMAELGFEVVDFNVLDRLVVFYRS